MRILRSYQLDSRFHFPRQIQKNYQVSTPYSAEGGYVSDEAEEEAL